MNYYKLNNAICTSYKDWEGFNIITENEASKHNGQIFFLSQMEIGISRRSFSLSDSYLINIDKENINILNNASHPVSKLPDWLENKIYKREVTYINTNYPKWMDVLNFDTPEKWKVNIVGLGDVGGTLAVGLRLLASDCISEIGIYDLDLNKRLRWKYELGQIYSSSSGEAIPEIKVLNDDELFDCDMFVFCVSIGVPPISEIKQDVRMLQFEGNSRIINHYAKLARVKNYKGIFSVVSDPVELLCKSALLSSNTNDNGELDFLGLAPEQIRGYGLGVMNARAIYYSNEIAEFKCYKNEGRAFGQHGEGLVIANSIDSYDEDLSSRLTDMVKKANIEVRKTGFKPYIAPALSSGSLSIIETIKGNWHYSSTFIGGVYFGAKNRLLKSGIELETLGLPDKLLSKLNEEFIKLGEII